MAKGRRRRVPGGASATLSILTVGFGTGGPDLTGQRGQPRTRAVNCVACVADAERLRHRRVAAASAPRVRTDRSARALLQLGPRLSLDSTRGPEQFKSNSE